MNIATDTNAVQLKKPGPLTRAAGGLSIDTTPTDPDTDGRRQYSPNAGQAFAYRPEVAGIASGMDSTATQSPATEPAPLSGIAAPVVPGSSPPAKGIAAITQPGRNAEGVITAESAKGAMSADMQRSGGAFGTMDMKGVNDIMARENQARGEMIDSMIKTNGGNGIAILPDPNESANAERTQRWAIDDLTGRMDSAGTRTERAAYGQALNQAIAGQNQLALEATRQQGDLNRRGITAEIEKTKQAGIDQRAAERNQIQARGQDITASTAADRIASQERIAEQRTDAGTRLSLPQVRSNREIDAARERVAGLSPDEIKRKTANYTATGRENPDFDPTLAKAVSLANRRKYGADDHFDSREQAQQQPAGTDGDVMTRFRADRGMLGHKTGKMTEYGLEVFDASGRLIGHYK